MLFLHVNSWSPRFVPDPFPNGLFHVIFRKFSDFHIVKNVIKTRVLWKIKAVFEVDNPD